MNRATPPYAGYHDPAESISYAVWLYFRCTLSFREIEALMAARGILVIHETLRQRGLKCGQPVANAVQRRLPRPSDKWHLDEGSLKSYGQRHDLWRAVDQDGPGLDILLQTRATSKPPSGFSRSC